MSHCPKLVEPFDLCYTQLWLGSLQLTIHFHSKPPKTSKIQNMYAFNRSSEAIKSLRNDIFDLPDCDRDTLSTILYVFEPSVRRNSPSRNNIAIDLQEISDENFQCLRDFVNSCFLRMRKELEIQDLGRDLMKLPGKSIFNFLIF